MNPLRKQKCPGCNYKGNNIYCLFLHKLGKVAVTSKMEQELNRNGKVRCPEEWEITAKLTTKER